MSYEYEIADLAQLRKTKSAAVNRLTLSALVGELQAGAYVGITSVDNNS